MSEWMSDLADEQPNQISVSYHNIATNLKNLL